MLINEITKALKQINFIVIIGDSATGKTSTILDLIRINLDEGRNYVLITNDIHNHKVSFADSKIDVIYIEQFKQISITCDLLILTENYYLQTDVSIIEFACANFIECLINIQNNLTIYIDDVPQHILEYIVNQINIKSILNNVNIKLVVTSYVDDLPMESIRTLSPEVFVLQRS